MRKSSLKRMLEAAETGNLELNAKNSKSEPALDLYDLPSIIPSEEIERVLESVNTSEIDVQSASDVQDLVSETTKCLDSNRSERIQHAHDPSGYMHSEIELDVKIKKFHSVVLDSNLIEAFIAHGGCQLFSDILVHPNEDICIEALRVLDELIREATVISVSLISAFSEASLDDRLISLLPRLLNDAAGCLLGLQISSTIISESQNVCPPAFVTCKFLNVLSQLIQDTWDLPEWLYNRSLASEVLLDVLESIPDPVALEKCVTDDLLRVLVEFGSMTPSTSDPLAEELRDNLIDCLVAILSISVTMRSAAGRLRCVEKFLDLTNDHHTRTKALEVIEASIRSSPDNCCAMIQCGGLKHAGKGLVETNSPKNLELVLAIMNSLLRNTSGTPHARVVGKMIEKDFEKTRIIIETYLGNYRRVRSLKVDSQLSETDVYLMKCEAGLSLIQQSVVVIIRLFAEPNEVLRKRILDLLGEMKVDIQRFIRSVFEYIAMINSEDPNSDADALREHLMLFQSQAL